MRRCEPRYRCLGGRVEGRESRAGPGSWGVLLKAPKAREALFAVCFFGGRGTASRNLRTP